MHIVIVLFLIVGVFIVPTVYGKGGRRAVQAKTVPVVSRPEVQKPTIIQPLPAQQIPPVNISKENVVSKLDELLLRSEINDVWYASTNDLVFDLALLDRNLAREYLKKIHNKAVEVAVAALPAPSVEKVVPKETPTTPTGVPSLSTSPTSNEQMKKGIPPAPPAPMQKGTPPAAPGGMKKGIPPAAPGAGTPPPPPGPMVKGKKAGSPAASPVTPPAPKGPELLSIDQTYGTKQLEKRTTEELQELFNKLLDALSSKDAFWDAEKKKPQPVWENRIDTLKKVLFARDSKGGFADQIAKRIVQVRNEKAQKGLAKQEATEQPGKKEEAKEVYRQEDLLKEIELLKKKEDPANFLWLIEFQGSVKKLDTVNHEKAVEYESEFIKKFPGQKPFLPKKKEAGVTKESTKEEQLVAKIDKIIADRGSNLLWNIKVREPIQELYDMNQELGLEYQQKIIDIAKKDTGKTDKPFLQLKK